MTMVNSGFKGLILFKSLLFKHLQDLQMLCLNPIQFPRIHRRELMGRGSETKLQVGENLIEITWRVKG